MLFGSFSSLFKTTVKENKKNKNKNKTKTFSADSPCPCRARASPKKLPFRDVHDVDVSA